MVGKDFSRYKAQYWIGRVRPFSRVGIYSQYEDKKESRERKSFDDDTDDGREDDDDDAEDDDDSRDVDDRANAVTVH